MTHSPSSPAEMILVFSRSGALILRTSPSSPRILTNVRVFLTMFTQFPDLARPGLRRWPRSRVRRRQPFRLRRRSHPNEDGFLSSSPELITVPPGCELGPLWLADANQLGAFPVPGHADVVRRDPCSDTVEEPFAILDGFPAFFDGAEVPPLALPTDDPQATDLESKAKRLPMGKCSTTWFSPRGLLQNMQVEYMSGRFESRNRRKPHVSVCL